MATAVALRRIGLESVIVLERQESLSRSGTALGLWTNAWRALDALEVGDLLREEHPVLDRIELCSQNSGRLIRSFCLQECAGGPHEFRGVRRSSLIKALASQLPVDAIHLGAEVKIVESDARGISLSLQSGERISCDALVAADGVRSPALMASGRRNPNFVGQIAIRGIAQFPAGVPCNCIRQIWSIGPRAGMYPISSTELYWFVCFDESSDMPDTLSDAEAIRKEARNIIKDWGWNMPEIVDSTPSEDLVRNRLVDRLDLAIFLSSAIPSKDHSGLPLTLAGDALHPMTPNLGQGGCTALEDAVALGREIAESGWHKTAETEGISRRIAQSFRSYEHKRLKRCLPLTWRSRVIGALLQLPLPPVAMARDGFIENLFNPEHFLDHASFDCGTLDSK